MSTLQVKATLGIQDGKLDQFKTIGKACMESVREKDTGTLQYNWFISDEGTECVVLEQYVDSDAALQHMGNLGQILGELLSISSLSLEVYGTPSEKLTEALQGLDVKVYPLFQKL